MSKIWLFFFIDIETWTIKILCRRLSLVTELKVIHGTYRELSIKKLPMQYVLLYLLTLSLKKSFYDMTNFYHRNCEEPHNGLNTKRLTRKFRSDNSTLYFSFILSNQCTLSAACLVSWLTSFPSLKLRLVNLFIILKAQTFSCINFIRYKMISYKTIFNMVRTRYCV